MKVIRPTGINAQIKAYMRFNGANGSTSFWDESQSHRTISVNGNAQLSSAQSKFGGTSGYFDGTGDYILIPYSSDFDFTGNFTIGFWLRRSSSQPGATYRGIFSQNTYNTAGFSILENGTSMYVYSGGSQVITGSLPAADTWAYISIIRSGSGIALYINGSQSGSTWTNSNTLPCHANGIAVMARHFNLTDNCEAGYVDDLVIYNGIALSGSAVPRRQLI